MNPKEPARVARTRSPLSRPTPKGPRYTPEEVEGIKELGERITIVMTANGQTLWDVCYSLAGGLIGPDGEESQRAQRAISLEKTVKAWMQGTRAPALPRLGPLADILGVSVDYLLGRVDDPFKAIVPNRRGKAEVAAAIKRLGAAVQQAQGSVRSRSSREAAQSPSPAQPRRAQRQKPE